MTFERAMVILFTKVAQTVIAERFTHTFFDNDGNSCLLYTSVNTGKNKNLPHILSGKVSVDFFPKCFFSSKIHKNTVILLKITTKLQMCIRDSLLYSPQPTYHLSHS